MLKYQKLSWKRAIKIYKLCSEHGYFDDTDNKTENSPKPFGGSDEDESSTETKNDRPIGRNQKNLNLLKLKNKGKKRKVDNSDENDTARKSLRLNPVEEIVEQEIIELSDDPDKTFNISEDLILFLCDINPNVIEKNKKKLLYESTEGQ